MGGFFIFAEGSLLSYVLAAVTLFDLLGRFKSRTVLGVLESLTISDAQGAMVSI
jgi:hypothetical protein